MIGVFLFFFSVVKSSILNLFYLNLFIDQNINPYGNRLVLTFFTANFVLYSKNMENFILVNNSGIFVFKRMLLFLNH